VALRECLILLLTILPSSNSSNALPDYHNSTSSSSGSSPLQAISNTGLATTVANDSSGRILMYYQDPDGRIIENSFLNSSWTLEDSSKINRSVVTTDATPGSPLAAISYTLNGQQIRQLFYFDGSGNVKTVNSSTTTTDSIATSWSAPYALSTDPASSSGTAGLAACVDHRGLNGIRVYYGSQGYEAIQEVGLDFNNETAGWQLWNTFDGSDQNSGVACVIYDGLDSSGDQVEYMNVYLLNTTTHVIQQNWWNYLSSDGCKEPQTHELGGNMDKS
jgi:hypothetical protein